MMTTTVDLQSLEQLCETLYNPPSSDSRIHAESVLNFHFPVFSSLEGASGSDQDGSNGGLDGKLQSHNPNISSPIGSALLCRDLLESSKNPYALMFATSRLKALVDDHFNTFSLPEQSGLRSFVLQHIYQHPDSPQFILASQAQLFGVITKLGWIGNAEFRPLLDHVQVFFQHGLNHRILGIQLLSAVALEMNFTGTKNAATHRKAAVGFRDGQLLPIFKNALSMLQTALQMQQSDNETSKLNIAILSLIKTCLSFDFIGTSYEETSDDVGSIQVPALWRSVFEEPGYLDLLWGCWKSFSSPASVVAMECLSQAASIRRSLFSTDADRHTYIYHIMRETIWTLTTAAGQNKLQDLGNFHEFCRMLSRFKSTYQLAEVCDYKESDQWLAAVSEFTARGFHAWKWSPNSVQYLLMFWNKTVSSLMSAKQETEMFIGALTVDLTRAYLKSRLDCVHAVMDGEVDDPLESEETLLISLEAFANIARTKYVESGQLILTEVRTLSQKYQELIQRASSLAGSSSAPIGSSDLKEQLMVVEMQLTWMVYIIGACIGGRVLYQSTAEQDQMDGTLACEVLGFIHQLQVWTARRSLYLASPDAHLHVQSSIIYFYSRFRESYIGEDAAKAVKVYTQLGDRWGLQTPKDVLDVIVSSSLSNLQTSNDPAWKSQEDQLVVRTLRLYTNLSSGYSSVKYMRKLKSMQDLLRNHNSDDFKFLDPSRRSSDTVVSRSRTVYYTMLSRILFADDNVDADFWRFIRPWEVILNQVMLAFEGKGGLGEAQIRMILLGMFKDLRGFVTSITNRRQFTLFFEWFYPTYTPIVLRAIELWPQDELGIATLRFWHEFATNKSNRVTFDSSSANGILLFRETSNILYTYGRDLLNRPISSESSKWREKYKGIMLYFNIMSVSLSGKYTNFGVFKLYGDKALDRVLEIFFQLMLAIPVADMIAFSKLSVAYYTVLDVFAAEHMMGLPMIPHSVLEYMFRSLGEVVPAHVQDASCSTLACSAIDKICTFVLNWLIKNKIRQDGNGEGQDAVEMIDSDITGSGGIAGGGEASFNGVPSLGPISLLKLQQQHGSSLHWLVEYVLSNKALMSHLFVVLFQVFAFENRNNHWSLSRPLLGLILLNREFYEEYSQNFVQNQLPDRRDHVQVAVAGLMEGVEDNLTMQNRDRFTTNATAFRRECSQLTLMAVPLGDRNEMQ
ncbi:exportin-7 [Entomortierella parvispora]|uniref:Exportin-7 n=1 Tax=Entomortierella parvispora TaxID=205924 RepID=A0A9P3H2H7_9FUNG|nr:exportin-7 [Entomortierella parvispora]